jgi:hypothetical protein
MVDARSRPAAQSPKFRDRLPVARRLRGRPPDLAQAYVGWARASLRLPPLRPPETRGEAAIGALLTHRAVERGAPLPQPAPARAALRCLYREFRHRELGPIPVRYTRPPTCRRRWRRRGRWAGPWPRRGEPGRAYRSAGACAGGGWVRTERAGVFLHGVGCECSGFFRSRRRWAAEMDEDICYNTLCPRKGRQSRTGSGRLAAGGFTKD